MTSAVAAAATGTGTAGGGGGITRQETMTSQLRKRMSSFGGQLPAVPRRSRASTLTVDRALLEGRSAAPSVSRVSTNTQSGLSVDGDLKDFAAGEVPNIRAVKAVVNMRRPRITSEGMVSIGGSLQDDFPKIVPLLEDDQPYALLIYVKDWPDSRVDWVLIVCTQDDTPPNQQALWARGLLSIRKLAAKLGSVRQLNIADGDEATMDFIVQSARWGAYSLEGHEPDIEVTVAHPDGHILASIRVPVHATVAEVRDEARRKCTGSTWVNDLVGEDGRPLKLGCQLAELQLSSPARFTAVLGEVTNEERAVARAQELQDAGHLPMKDLRSVGVQDEELKRVSWHKFAAYETSKAGMDVVRVTYSGPPKRQETNGSITGVAYVLTSRGSVVQRDELLKDLGEVSAFLQQNYPDVQVLEDIAEAGGTPPAVPKAIA